MTKRISYIDQIKGFAIFLVVLGHVVEHNAGRDNCLWTFIYSFHMPLFMFVSGYLAYVTFKIEQLNFSSVISYISKKSRTLLLPFLSWGIFIPYFVLHNTNINFYNCIYNFIYSWGGGLWFFATLFALSLLFLLFKKVTILISKQNIFWDILILCILGGIVVTLYELLRFCQYGLFVEGLRSILSYFIFYFSGVLVGKHKWLDVLFSDKRIFSLLSLTFVLLFPFFVYDMSSVFNQIMKVLLAFLAIPCTVYIITHIKWNIYLDEGMQWFGRESLAIYVTHNGPFAFLLGMSDMLPLSDANNLYSIFLFFIISIFISLIAIGMKGLLSLSPVLEFLLYGKNNKNNI